MPPANGLEIPCRGGVHRSRINYIPGVQASHRKKGPGPGPGIPPPDSSPAFAPFPGSTAQLERIRLRAAGGSPAEVRTHRGGDQPFTGHAACHSERDSRKGRYPRCHADPQRGVEDCLPLRILATASPGPYAKELPQGDRRGATPAATLLTPSLARRSGKEDGAAGNRPGRSRPIQQLQLLDRSARSPRSVGDPSPKNRPVMERSQDPGRQSRSGAAPSATGIPPSLPEGRYCRA